jgi:hypothetical protein
MSERRRATRQRSLLQGRLFYNKRRNSVDCIIRDISETGARLKFSAAVTVPEALELYVPNRDECFRVRVEWRQGEEVGVTFVQPKKGAATAAGDDDLAERVKKLETELSSLRRLVSELKGELRQRQGDAA